MCVLDHWLLLLSLLFFSVFSIGIFCGEIFAYRLLLGVDHFETRWKFDPEVLMAMLLMRGQKSIMLLLTSSLFQIPCVTWARGLLSSWLHREFWFNIDCLHCCMLFRLWMMRLILFTNILLFDERILLPALKHSIPSIMSRESMGVEKVCTINAWISSLELSYLFTSAMWWTKNSLLVQG